MLQGLSQISYTLRSEHYVWLSSAKGEGKVKVSARHATKPDVRRCKVESIKVKSLSLSSEILAVDPLMIL